MSWATQPADVKEERGRNHHHYLQKTHSHSHRHSHVITLWDHLHRGSAKAGIIFTKEKILRHKEQLQTKIVTKRLGGTC